MNLNILPRLACTIILVSACWSGAASAAEEGSKGRRVRVGLGPQWVPSYPGADDVSLRPLTDLSFARGDKPFEFEAPDESIGLSLIKKGGLGIGPALSLEGSRKPSDVGADLDKVDTTIEAGIFVQYRFGPKFRIRAEGRRGLGGHDGWIGNVSADFIARKGDAYVFSIGPRLTLADRRYQRAYFGVTPAEAARTGLALHDPGAGVQAFGGASGLLVQIDKAWGIFGYAKYDRIVGDAGRSPIVRSYGSRDQFSGGVALTYTFRLRRK